MKICECPLAEALPVVPNVDCPENFGQIAKIAFQRVYSDGTTKNSFTTEAGIEKLASWQTLISAIDGTKVSISPIVEAPTQDGGDPITFGGGNETVGGMERIIGSNPTTMTVVIRECPQNVIAELKKMQCEKQLGVYLINEAGQIEALVDKEAQTTYYPIPIYNFYVGDKIHGGFDTPDSNTITFSLPANYSDQLRIITPEFNAMTDLLEA